MMGLKQPYHNEKLAWETNGRLGLKKKGFTGCSSTVRLDELQDKQSICSVDFTEDSKGFSSPLANGLSGMF